jgi:hypothetical protein
MPHYPLKPYWYYSPTQHRHPRQTYGAAPNKGFSPPMLVAVYVVGMLLFGMGMTRSLTA